MGKLPIKVTAVIKRSMQFIKGTADSTLLNAFS